MQESDWLRIHALILQLEQEGKVTRTFRRLDPGRQAAVLSAILEEAADRGPAAINIKQVAERAEVSVGSLYMYFDSRDGMLDFAVELSARFLTESLHEFGPLLAELPLREALSMYLMGGVEWSKTYSGLLRLFVRAAYQGDPALSERLVKPVATALQDIVRAIFTQAADRGEIRPDVDLEMAIRLVNALMIAVGDGLLVPYLNTYFRVYGDDAPPKRMLNVLLDMIIHGIGAES